ncbi:RagB/SusD family nutrient uptake outer membrane protein [Solitalea koreensis]|uniref:RagB/SusD domain-containing protein n=1 Tax=Solitalea koreensis TaxID=543615 RepID=A0A521AUJ6_9SPHI|nr:RagB/SusD family nutrient uptake outer membrane protein [Solitalea koreensis]SMO38518.1 RagB/SusD domain-containing protein [Solitalea koreensis]
MKTYIKIKSLLILSVMVCFLSVIPYGCKLDDNPDPNHPSTDVVLNNASVVELNNVVVGSEAGMRDAVDFYLDDVGVVGRDIYRFSGSDPRYTQDLLGQGSATLDNNAFYTTRLWNAAYRVIKNCNTLLAAVDNTSSPTEEQKQGYRAFANTIKAYQLLLALNLTNENGVRIEVSDPTNLGPIVPHDQALAAIAALLDQASTQLDAAGASFAFQLSPGFLGFNTPANFKKFNRALAARVAVYRNDFAGALAILPTSFLDINGNFQSGVYHVFSNLAGDQLNKFFNAPNAGGEIRVAQPNFLSDAIAAGEGADLRLSKIAPRTTPASQGGLTGTHDVVVYKSNTDPIAIIRNEELILIYAEANIQTNQLANAVVALNIIRTKNNLLPYAGAVTQTALITEMLKQRRYSLYVEGHRWVDMRRYGRLAELPLDRPGDNVWNCFPVPFAENVTSTCQ